MPEAEAKEGARNMFASLGIRLRQQCQFVTSAFFFLLKQFCIILELIKAKETAISAESQASKNVCLEKIRSVGQ